MNESKLSKTNIKYWEAKLVHRTHGSGGKTETPDWYVQLNHLGKQRWVSMQTSNKAIAARKAKEAYFLLKANGWEALWEVFKVRKNDIKVVINESLQLKTIGEVISLIGEKCPIKPKTLMGYIRCFYKIISDIFNVKSGNEKYDYVNGGGKKRMDQIHSVLWNDITKDRIEEWKNNSLKQRIQNNEHSREAASTTINSLLRGAKNLFSKKMITILGLDEKMISPFVNVKYLPEGSSRYTTKFDAEELIKKAKDELKSKNSSAYVVLLLALCAGLRRNEIDKLLWEQVDFERGYISIYTTEYFIPKSRESSSQVCLDSFVIDELKESKQDAKGIFVIESKVPPRVNATYRHCRCERDYNELYKWLKENGVNYRNPLHTLRKEYGAEICRKHGLYLASRALRHSSYSMTERFYVDKTAMVTPGFLNGAK